MKQFLRIRKLVVLIITGTMFFMGDSFGQGQENFTNLPTSSSTSYLDRVWTGNDGGEWKATGVRTDQIITDKAICWGNSDQSSRNLVSPEYSGGIGTLSFKYSRAYTSGSARCLEVYINSTLISTITVNPTSDEIVTYSENINITGNVVLEIKSIGAAQVKLDDITWTGLSGGTPAVFTPTISPKGGDFFEAQNISITTSTEGADIYYSFVGADGPWTHYLNVINIASTTTVWSYASKDGMDNSFVCCATFNFPVDVVDISALRAGTPGGQLYHLTSQAILTLQCGLHNQKYIQDATGAIIIDDADGVITTSYYTGDGITGFIGSLKLYNKMLQFIPVKDPGVATSNNNIVVPEVVTLATLTTAHQARVVRVKSVSISKIDVDNFAASKSYNIDDGTLSDGDFGILYTAYSDLDYIDQPIPIVVQDITGVVLQNNSVLRLVPRSLIDIVPTGTSSVTSSNYQEIIFFPNPVSDELHIKSEGYIVKVEVYNMAGQLVANYNKDAFFGHELIIPFDRQNGGVYLIKITNKAGMVVVKKIVKKSTTIL